MEGSGFFYKVLTGLSIRVFNDKLPTNSDAVYLVGQTADNQESVLNVGSELLLTGAVGKIIIPGG